MFGIGKKADKAPEKQETAACCGNTQDSGMQAENRKPAAGVVVLGLGCSRCHEMHAHAEEALKELGVPQPVEMDTDYRSMARYGVMSLPALVVNGQVLSYGRVLKKNEVKELLRKALNL